MTLLRRNAAKQCRLSYETLEPRQMMFAGGVLDPCYIPEVSIAGEPPTIMDDTFADAHDLGVVAGPRGYTDWVGRSDADDFYRFEIDDESNVTLRLEKLTQDIDLYLYDASGDEIARSWRGWTTNEHIEVTLNSGTYYASVRPWWTNESNYHFSLDVDAGGNSLNEARDLGSVAGSREISDWVGQSDANDFFRFVVDEESDVSLRLEGLTQDLDLYLYDISGAEIARSWRMGTASETIDVTLGPGSYYISVRPWSSHESTYRLEVEVHADEASPLPDVPYFGGPNEWNLNAINAPEAWAYGFTGEDVVVAVVDTGVDYYHTDLANNIWSNHGEVAGNGIDDDGNGFVDDYRGWDFAYGDNEPLDQHGHGTHVSGTIAAVNNGVGATGVAYDAVIMPVQVLFDSGSGSYFSVGQGIRYAVDNGADIINLSLGGGYSSVVADALSYAEQMGVVVVAAAGNGAASMPGYPARHSADYANVLSVGAHDSTDRLAGFSNRVGSSGAVQVDAPGVAVYSTLPGNRYGSWAGTSMATPHVAGLAALALSANPSLTASEVRSLIVQGADRSIAGSDSIGGVNAAMTLAPAGDALDSSAIFPVLRERTRLVKPEESIATFAWDRGNASLVRLKGREMFVQDGSTRATDSDASLLAAGYDIERPDVNATDAAVQDFVAEFDMLLGALVRPV